jgi:hypothetical protein
MAGMVGRIIVGRAVGPGLLPFDYFKAQGRDWMPVPPEAQRAFPKVSDILEQKRVRLEIALHRLPLGGLAATNYG